MRGGPPASGTAQACSHNCLPATNFKHFPCTPRHRLRSLAEGQQEARKVCLAAAEIAPQHSHFLPSQRRLHSKPAQPTRCNMASSFAPARDVDVEGRGGERGRSRFTGSSSGTGVKLGAHMRGVDKAASATPGGGHFMALHEGNWYTYDPSTIAVPGASAAKRTVFGAGQDTPAAAPATATATGTLLITPALVGEWRSAGMEALRAEGAAHMEVAEADRSRDGQWLRQVLSSGTRSDRVAAMALMTQQDALHSLRHVRALVNMCAKRVRKEAYLALDTTKDLFLTNLLPHDRRLRTFDASVAAWAAAHPAKAPAASAGSAAGVSGESAKKRRRGGRRRKGGAADDAKGGAKGGAATAGTWVAAPPSPAFLVLWAFEEELRAVYGAFLSALEDGANDAMAHMKRSSMRCAAQLLEGAPEGEGRLLSLLVNKLGDPDRKVATNAQHHLHTLCLKHTAMKTVVVKALRTFVLDPRSPQRGQFYGLSFLSQLPLHREWGDLTSLVLSTYLLVFQQTLVQKPRKGRHAPAKAADEGDAAAPPAGKKAAKAAAAATITRVSSAALGSRMLAAILTGLNRALPYVLGMEGGEGGEGGVPPALAPLVSQLDAVFQVTRGGPYGTRVQALMLIHAVGKALVEREGGNVAAADAAATATSAAASPGGRTMHRFFKALYDALLDPDLLTTRRAHHMLLNLVFRVLRHEPSALRVRAVAKRLAQVAATAAPPLACGILVLLSTLLRERPGVLGMLHQPEVAAGADQGGTPGSGTDSDAGSASDDAEDDEEEGDPLLQGAGGEGSEAAGDTQQQQQQQQQRRRRRDTRPQAGMYDPRARDPSDSGAASACLWELLTLATHYHPSVRRFAELVLAQGGPAGGPGIQYDGDPMADMTLMAFLDRLAFRKPKKKAVAAVAAKGAAAAAEAADSDDEDAQADALVAGTLRGPSVMQRRGMQGMRTGFAAVATPADSKAFAALPASKVRAEEAFMHGFFQARAQRAAEAGEAAPLRGPADEEVGDDEADAFADELAEELMAEHAATTGMEDGEDDDLDDFAYDLPEEVEGEEEQEGGASDSEGGSDPAFDGAAVLGSDSEEEEEAPAPGKKGTKRPRRAVFAAAEDYDLSGDEAEQAPPTPPPRQTVAKGKGGKKHKGSKKRRK